MGYKTIKQLKAEPIPRRDGYARPIEAVMFSGLSISTIRRMELAGKFPKKVKLGERSCGYRWSELRAWDDSRYAVKAV
jgi:predicted DNA-binding transcriptional regulator AlpA